MKNLVHALLTLGFASVTLPGVQAGFIACSSAPACTLVTTPPSTTSGTCGASYQCMCVLGSNNMPGPFCVKPCSTMDRYGNCPPPTTKTIDFARTPAVFALNVSRIYRVAHDLTNSHTFYMTIKGSILIGTTNFPTSGESIFTVTVMMNGNVNDSDTGKEMNYVFVDKCFHTALDAMTLMRLNFNHISTSNVKMQISSWTGSFGTGVLTTDANSIPIDLAFYGFYDYVGTPGTCSIEMPASSVY